jgi:hypothetical protein
MGHWEDFWWNITEEVNKKGLKKEFDAQLEKMNGQSKWQYADTRSRWDYAYHKVINKSEKHESNTRKFQKNIKH